HVKSQDPQYLKQLDILKWGHRGKTLQWKLDNQPTHRFLIFNLYNKFFITGVPVRHQLEGCKTHHLDHEQTGKQSFHRN
ncbi:MAG: hypothetical protein M1113_02430, partial [Candidatus Thermoplasmatota archaeon]|nr:hypothetical protein [Candidatus Thermoplasmatota archaeon]